MGFSEQRDSGAIQARLWKGYGKVARQQGTNSGVYRPDNPLDPFANNIGELPIVFSNDYGFAKPNKFGCSWLFAIFDGTNVQEGDYLITPPLNRESEEKSRDVFYVASMRLNVPIVVVRCQRTITVSRSKALVGKGALGYSASTQNTETILMQGWKASILQGTKGENNPANLPLDVRMPWWTIFIPAFSELVLDTGDIVRCDLDRKYVVSSAELTEMGWRITAVYERA